MKKVIRAALGTLILACLCAVGLTAQTQEEQSDIEVVVTASRVEIRLRGGRTLSRLVEVPKGDPRDPMEAPHLAEKLKQFAPGRDTDRIERLIETTTALEKVGDIRELTSLV